MSNTMRFVGMGVFLVLVLAALGFFLSQDEGIPTTANATKPHSATDSTGIGTAVAENKSAAPAETQTGSPEPEQPAAAPAAAEDTEKEPAPTKEKRPRGPGILKGVVTWHADGAPVAGASILLDYVDRPHGYDPYPEQQMQWTATSDGKGQFRIANLPVNKVGAFGGRLTVTASKDGASAVTSAMLTDDETQTLVELVLRPSGGIGGQVVDESGAPIKGAIVVPNEMTDKTQQQYSYGAMGLWSASDENGQFLVENLNEGSWKLAVHAEHYADVITEPFKTGETNAKVVLKRGASASGKVIRAADAEPVDGAFVTINSANRGGNPRRAGSDKEGAFQADALADGDYAVYLDDETRVLVGEPPKFTIAGGKSVDGIVLTVADGGSISGMVTDAGTGEPIEGVRIAAQGNQTSTNRQLQGTSDASGFYEITGVPAGSYTMRRRWKEGYRHGEERENKTVSLTLGEVLENIDFAVPRGLAMSGTVVDEAGDPVEGVTVNCTPVVENGEGEDVQTTEDGAFAVRGFSPNVDVNIQVSGRGYTAPKVGPLGTGDSGMSDIKIVVNAGASVSGIVVDTAGKPLAEMYVTVSSPQGGSGAMEATGPDGTFVVKSLDEGTYHLAARRQNSWSSRQQGGQDVTVAKGEAVTGVRLVFEGATGSTISGTILNGKREPVQNASVQAYSPTGGSNAYIQSGADGKYELSVDDGVTYHMNVNHQNYTTQQRDDVKAGARNEDFILEGRGSVEGQVLDAATGKPIPNFEIAQSPGQYNQDSYQVSNYVSFYNEEGRFTVSDVEAGQATVFARAAGYAPASQQVPQVRAGEVTGGVVFHLKAGASIEGTVVDTQGAPVQSAQIFLSGRVEPWMISQGGSGYGAVATSDAEGHFTIPSLGEDLTKITAVHPSYPNTTVDVAIVPGQTIQVEIVMSGGGTVEGTVTANGAPAASQQVYVQQPSTGNYQSATTDEHGFYTIGKISPGEVTVGTNVERDGARRGQNKSAVVEAGTTTTVDLNVDFGTGSIEGKVTAGGQPVTQGNISAMLQGGDTEGMQNISGSIAADGSYTISGLSAGTYKLMVQAGAPGGSQPRMRVVGATLEEGQALYLDIDLDDGSHVHGAVANVSGTNMCQVVAITGAFQLTNPATDFITPDFQSRVAGVSQVDAAGTYDLGGLPPGDFTIVAVQIGAPGLENATFATGQITVGDSGAVELNLTLP